jgi:hypothetical protein
VFKKIAAGPIDGKRKAKISAYENFMGDVVMGKPNYKKITWFII